MSEKKSRYFPNKLIHLTDGIIDVSKRRETFVIKHTKNKTIPTPTPDPEPIEPTYIETEIAVIELDSDDQRTLIINYFNTPDEVKAFFVENYVEGKKYEVRFGKNVPQLFVLNPAWLAGFGGIRKFTAYSGLYGLGVQTFAAATNLKEVYTENIPFGYVKDDMIYSQTSSLFGGCSSLEKVTILGDSQHKYQSYWLQPGTVFGGCSSLKEVRIEFPMDVIYTGFAGVPSLETLTIKNVIHLNTDVFANCTALKTAHIEADMDAITAGCFSGCTSLETLTGNLFTRMTQGINNDAFKNCSSLVFNDLNLDFNSTSVSSNYVGENSFKNCEGITSLTISSVASDMLIHDNAFDGCSNMTSVTINASGILHLAEKAFANCTSLRTVVLNASGGYSFDTRYDMFDGCDNIEITINHIDETHLPGGPWGATNATIIWND